MPTKTLNPPLKFLCQDFRHHLEQFYASLNLAPPYHSLEKAVRLLSVECQKKPREELEHLTEDANRKWCFYGEIFSESGLADKHRGIILGLMESDKTPNLSTQYHIFLRTFHPKTSGRSSEKNYTTTQELS